MSDITLLSEVLNVVLIPSVVILIDYVRKLTPKIKTAVHDVEVLKTKTNMVIVLIDKLSKFADDLTDAAADREISSDESQNLLTEIEKIRADPAVIDLKELVKQLN